MAWGPIGLFLLAVLDSAGIPLPASVDVLIVYLAAKNPAMAVTSAIIAVCGSALGCMILFFIARKGGELYLDAHTATGMTARFRRWFQRYGLATVFVPGVVPILPLPMKVFVASAGALGVRPLRFLLVVLAARIPRYLGLAYLGAKLGEHSLEYLRQHTWHLLGLALLLLALILVVLRLAGRRPVRKGCFVRQWR
ncbi:MAG: VTT domain-containing protein [Bryobacterales bacterium]|nr:VTT domain-containing protein [Bryobacterales bacterium]